MIPKGSLVHFNTSVGADTRFKGILKKIKKIKKSKYEKTYLSFDHRSVVTASFYSGIIK